MPIMVIPIPRTRAASPLSTLSATTEEVAMNANSASAKNSGGPKAEESATSVGEMNTTSTEATMPPTKAPIAAVASACGARPALAMRCPSKVEAMAEACPGVFSRIAMVESPNRPPKYTPAKRMNAAVGSRAKVMGSSSATAIEDPSPGRTPTAVPSRQPTTTQSRFIGLRAPAKPCISRSICSIRTLLPGSRRAGSGPARCRRSGR